MDAQYAPWYRGRQRCCVIVASEVRLLGCTGVISFLRAIAGQPRCVPRLGRPRWQWGDCRCDVSSRRRSTSQLPSIAAHGHQLAGPARAGAAGVLDRRESTLAAAGGWAGLRLTDDDLRLRGARGSRRQPVCFTRCPAAFFCPPPSGRDSDVVSVTELSKAANQTSRALWQRRQGASSTHGRRAAGG